MSTVDTLKTMSREKFAEVVDNEVRGHAAPDLAQGLRDPEVADRWYAQLVHMKKNVESTLAAKASEDKAQRLALLAAAEDAESPEQARDLRKRALQAREGYLKWRTGALRFRAGVEERIAEASWRRRQAGTYVPTQLLEERNNLLQRVGALTEAVEAHKASMADLDPDDIDEADEQLWAVLVDGSRPGKGRKLRS